MSVEEVRALLQEFQNGYTARDRDRLDRFMDLFVQSDELEVIGTKGIRPGEQEWCCGTAAVRGLIEDDWQGWGDVVFDVDGAHITVQGDVAWLATAATATMTIPTDHVYGGFLAQTKNTLEDEVLSPRDKMIEITRLGADLLFESPLGETFVWPFRFTAVAVRVNGAWKFHQMQFSYSNTRLPDVRVPPAQAPPD